MKYFCGFLVVAAIMGGCIGCAHEDRLAYESREKHELDMLNAGYCRSPWGTSWRKCP